MNEDPIKQWIKASKRETSEAFLEDTLDKLDARIQRRMQTRLYLLIAGVSLFMIVSMIFFLTSGFMIHAFGIVLGLPKYTTMIAISLLSYGLIYYLLKLFMLGNLMNVSTP